MSQSLDLLRQKHPRFIYESAEYEVVGSDLKLTYHFTLEPDIYFTPTLVFQNIDLALYAKLDQAIIKNWVFQIGMVELISYWKATCSPEIVVNAGQLDEEQIEFWQKLLKNGLSEFFYVNQLNGWQNNFVKFTALPPRVTTSIDQSIHQHRRIVSVGGGKDSAVSAELIKEVDQQLTTFTLNKNQQIQNLLDVAKPEQNISVLRTIDPKLLELNAQGYLNGHTPFSALLSFIITFSAYLFDYSDAILSNEHSANEGNTLFLGKIINHQYSKTYEYEQDFRAYLYKNISQTISYFSLLRPLHEIQIAEIFAKYPQYFYVFLSCNIGQKEGKWCGNCPKCLFVYIMLSPFLSQEELVKIFGQNLFEKESLKPIFDELTGMIECKSLECVGTREETGAALALTIQKWGDQPLPVLLQYAKDQLIVNDPQIMERAEKLLHGFQTRHFLTLKLERAVKEKIGLQ